MHPEMHTEAPEQQGQGELEEKDHLPPTPRKGMCRSEGGLGQPPKTLRAAVVRLCPAGGLSWGLLPSGCGAEGVWHHLGGVWEEEEKQFPKQSILSLVNREMLATGGCSQLDKSMDHSVPRAKAWSPCHSGVCRCQVSSRSGVPYTGCGKPL